MDKPLVRAEPSGGVLHVTLDRPEVRNAMSAAMVSELEAILERAEADDSTRVLVLRGAGGHFCAGGDIKDMARARMAERGDGPDPIHALSVSFGRLALRFSRASLPVVAVLEGAVMGGGFGLACTADVAIASGTADFRLPETSLGVLPAQIAPFLVERLGYSEAKRLALTGARLDAKAALAVGLVHEVCEDEDALEAALEATLTALLRCAPGATAATKRLMFGLFERVSERAIEDAAEAFTAAARGPEAAEGMAAFLGKRAPSWAAPKDTTTE